MKRVVVRTVAALAAVVLVSSACGGDSDDRAEGTTVSTEPGVIASPDDALDAVILADSLAQGGWPQRWAELVEADLDVEVVVHDHSVTGRADYDVLLQRSEVREALRDAEVVFISPDPDYLRDACPPGTSLDCVTEFSGQYREQWSVWLDQIGELATDAVLRSAKSWTWLAPIDRRAGLVEFMDQMAEETLAHGGLVADMNQALTGADYSDEPPPDWIDTAGHLTGPGADKMAELLHELGYEAAT